MQILRFPHPILFEECKQVSVFGPELKVLLDSMWTTMLAHRGIGLAANQVGLQFRMFTMIGIDDEKLYMVNPKITRRSVVPAMINEGCLSAPGEFITLTERASWVEVEFNNEVGVPLKRVFQGIHAVCVQHEIGHLDGESHLQSLTIPKQKRKELAKKWGLKTK